MSVYKVLNSKMESIKNFSDTDFFIDILTKNFKISGILKFRNFAANISGILKFQEFLGLHRLAAKFLKLGGIVTRGRA